MCIFLDHASVSWLGFNWCQLGWPGLNSRVQSSDHSKQFGVWSALNVSQSTSSQAKHTATFMASALTTFTHILRKSHGWATNQLSMRVYSVSNERIQIFPEQYSKHCEWVCVEDRAEKGKNIFEWMGRSIHYFLMNGACVLHFACLVVVTIALSQSCCPWESSILYMETITNPDQTDLHSRLLNWG